MKKGLIVFAALFLLACGFIFGAGTKKAEPLDSELDAWLNRG